ncbi:hypothetical protein CRYUN_Cryun24cG0065400 [Craigia yunnanensis]
MITYEKEHDFVKWSLQLFNSDPYANYGYGENDEAIAHTLQLQELSQLVVVGSPNHGEEEDLQLQVAGNPQDFVDQSVGDFAFGQDCGEEEQDDTAPFSSCSTPEEKLLCEEDWSYSLELTDEYALDGEVGKRLKQVVPVLHVPRINGEIPSVNEATLDHQRLLKIL